MARKDDLEDRLAQLAELRDERDADKRLKDLRAALTQRRSGLLVAKAAELIAELSVDGLSSEMEGTFLRLLVEPLKRDKGCLGKTAIAKSLVEQEAPAAKVFLAGVCFVQLEPTWGGSVDVASQLRGWCAHGLIRMRHRDAVLEITPLLVDPERPARLAAVDALGDSGQEAAEALLRLKALSGDEEPEVLEECFNSLLRLDAERSLRFVGDFLSAEDPAVVEGAALALGETRLESAIDLLLSRLDVTIGEELQRCLYLALALTRRRRAVDTLVDVLENGPIGRARSALVALALNRHDESLSSHLRQLVTERRNRELEALWRQEFES